MTPTNRIVGYYDRDREEAAPSVTATARAKYPLAAIRCRWMIAPDVEACVRLTHQDDSAESGPWSAWMIRSYMRNPDAIGMVAEVNGKVVGFFLYIRTPEEIVVTKFVVDREHRRRNVGAAMVVSLIRKLRNHRKKRVTFILRGQAMGARSFLKACGFREVELVVDGFGGPTDDAIVMKRFG